MLPIFFKKTGDNREKGPEYFFSAFFGSCRLRSGRVRDETRCAGSPAGTASAEIQQ
jgi:hypothetical protein